MPLALSLIVDGDVRLRDREALETLRAAHRVEMVESTRAVAERDITRMIATLNADIEIIDAGLSRLNAPREEQACARWFRGNASRRQRGSRPAMVTAESDQLRLPSP
ncbi:hypothetical protein FXB40_04000 [Bradyrhizobium rifense]|uniref:Uncharacterized protein n=1 Tax=Bradyrhizobium rifense TaxID=515499 RepID=A0A5D3KR71_9BRAD|nr:hypothetical protein [Bradyrhizobium rifense]TYL99271.1 hypothetical protein FXB40_04000 [Bradyrhizobium rifense]